MSVFTFAYKKWFPDIYGISAVHDKRHLNWINPITIVGIRQGINLLKTELYFEIRLTRACFSIIQQH
ncbi:hypothetical protein SIN01_11790 [Sporolactobacillus inulinus]|nr:hypothetical protein SIN01_11790 [Sporolactobacillus inulinus]